MAWNHVIDTMPCTPSPCPCAFRAACWVVAPASLVEQPWGCEAESLDPWCSSDIPAKSRVAQKSVSIEKKVPASRSSPNTLRLGLYQVYPILNYTSQYLERYVKRVKGRFTTSDGSRWRCRVTDFVSMAVLVWRCTTFERLPHGHEKHLGSNLCSSVLAEWIPASRQTLGFKTLQNSAWIKLLVWFGKGSLTLLESQQMDLDCGLLLKSKRRCQWLTALWFANSTSVDSWIQSQNFSCMLSYGLMLNMLVWGCSMAPAWRCYASCGCFLWQLSALREPRPDVRGGDDVGCRKWEAKQLGEVFLGNQEGSKSWLNVGMLLHLNTFCNYTAYKSARAELQTWFVDRND